MQPPSPPPLSLLLSLSFFLSLLLLLMEKLSPSPLPTHRRTEQKLIPQTWYNSASYSIISDLWSEKDTWIFVWAGPLHHCLETRVCQHWSFLEEKKVILSFNPVSSDSGRQWDQNKFLKICGWENALESFKFVGANFQVFFFFFVGMLFRRCVGFQFR